MSTTPILSIEGLKTYFFTPGGVVRAVDGVTLSLGQGETLGIVGESGCGKSITCLSVLGLIPPPGKIVGGKILFEGRDLVGMSPRELRRIRGKQIGMVFQDPLSSLNPFMTIGDQLTEPLTVHQRISRSQTRRRAAELLEKVGIPDAAHRLGDYPHRFSGGMRQRVMIAMALIGNPKILIADEPTTALDATIQAQVLDLFRQIQRELGVSILFVTHNLGVVAGMADRVAVMYAGRVVELAETAELFANPRHPYTLALLKAVPRMDTEGQPPVSMGGEPPDLSGPRQGCSFYERCPLHEEKCKEQEPPLSPVADADSRHRAACWVDVSQLRG